MDYSPTDATTDKSYAEAAVALALLLWAIVPFARVLI